MTAPSVLAVLVVHDAAPWLRRTLSALARQTHPRLGVLAVDSGSTDGSDEILESVLGKGRVLRLSGNEGFATAMRRALSVPAAAEADFVLMMHDDVVLSPEAVARMVEAAGRVPGVGLVGPKVLDSGRPGVLLEIGHSSDRFGNPFSPLEEGEIDQGQYDATREVLYVSSTAMLVARDAWRRAGLLDERLRSGPGDLDFGWRVRLAGFRVLTAPRAVVLHRLAGIRGERAQTDRSDRYLVERAGLASVLKNNRVVTLLWVMPLYVVQGLVRLIAQLLGRHFDRAWQSVRAWGWNLIHLPGTIRRRVRAQAVRHVADRDISQFMAPTGTGFRRWALRASAVLVARGETFAEEDEEPEIQPLRRRVRSLVADHPAGVGLVVAILLSLLAFREVLFVPRIEGGALPDFPSNAFQFFREFAASWRSTGFGGESGASPALVPLGVGSVLSLGNPDLLARLMVGLGPLAVALACHGALRRLRVRPAASVIGSACYALSALTLWAASEGRVATIVLLVALPPLAARMWSAVDDRRPQHPFRSAVGTGMILALTGVFFPAVWVAAAILLVPSVMIPGREGRAPRGLVLALVAGIVAVALVFPFAVMLAVTGGGSSVDAAGAAGFLSFLRLAPGPSPGSSIAAFFLPVAGLLAFVLVAERHRARAWRGLAVALVSAPLAWLAAAGHLAAPIANPVAFLAAGAVALSFLVAMATDSVGARMSRTAFGARQVTVALLGLVLISGIVVQAARAVGGGWAVGETRLSPAWPLVAGDQRGGPFRVLWLGAPGAEAFPAPGGDTQGVVSAGEASVSYGITGPEGRSALAIGLPAGGEGHEHLAEVLAATLSGRVRHGGALLGTFGVRYVVTGDEGIPPAVVERLGSQVDLDLLQVTAGLRIYRNARALAVGSTIPGSDAVAAARAGELLAPVELSDEVTPLEPDGSERWLGEIEETGLVYVAVDHASGWSVSDVPAFPAFGWAVGAEAPGGDVTVSYDGGLRRPLEIAAMAVLWLGALVLVRRRSEQSSSRPRSAREAARMPQAVGGRR